MGNGSIINLLRGKKVTFDYNYLDGTNLFDTAYICNSITNYDSMIHATNWSDADEGRSLFFTHITSVSTSGSNWGVYFNPSNNIADILKTGHTYTVSFFFKPFIYNNQSFMIGSERFGGVVPEPILIPTRRVWTRCVSTQKVTSTLSNSMIAFIICMKERLQEAYSIKDIQIAEVNGIKQEQMMYNSSRALPTPTRTGYTFLGWYDDPAEGNQVTKVGQLSTLYAHWRQNTPERLVLYDISRLSAYSNYCYNNTFTQYKQVNGTGSVTFTNITGQSQEIKSVSTHVNGGINIRFGLVTKGTVDLTRRRKITVEILSGSLLYLRVFTKNSLEEEVNPSATSSTDYTLVEKLDGSSDGIRVQADNTSVKKLELDVSALSGEYYVAVVNRNGSGNEFILKNLYVD